MYALFSLVLSAQVLVAPQAEGPELLAFTVDLHRMNLAKFQHGEFDFVVLQDRVASVDAIRSAASSITHLKMQGFYAFDRTNAVFSCTPTDQDLKSETVMIDGKMASTSLFTHRILTNSKDTCLDTLYVIGDKVDHRAVIQADKEHLLFAGHFQFVFPVGPQVEHTSRLLQDYNLLQSQKLSLKRCNLLDNRICIVEFTVGNSFRRYTIDMGRGAIPLKIEDLNASGEAILTVVCEEIVEVGEGCWIPYKKLVVNNAARIGRLFQILKGDCSSPVQTSRFVLCFDKPSNIQDDVNNKVLTNVSTINLNERNNMPARRFPPHSAAPLLVPELDNLPGVQRSSGIYYYGCLAVCVGSVFVAYFYKTHKKHTKNE